MGVKIQKPGEPGHPGGNRRTYVRVNYQGHRKTRVFNTKKGAEYYATQVEALLKLGKTDEVFTDPNPATPALTFQEATDRWWAVDGAGFKGGTRDTYENALKVHILPTFAARRLSDISVAEIEDWWAGIRAKGFSHKHLGNIRCVLVGIFRRASKTGLLPRNPA
ncbi:MAG TPA: hypothetical protein VN648_01665, partial [Candidatus Methylomirabilis sp.]|nr:hypothetical protein [Candidatus Methylomirabilis sp.]